MKEDQSTEPSFQKTHDYLYEYRGLHMPGGTCRIPVAEKPGGDPVVIASELTDNTHFGGSRIRIGDPAWRYIGEEEVERLLGQKPR